MSQNVKDIFSIGFQRSGDFLRRFPCIAQVFLDPVLKLQDASGCLLAGFDTRLMVCIDVDQAGIKADRPFVKAMSAPTWNAFTSGMVSVIDSRAFS